MLEKSLRDVTQSFAGELSKLSSLSVEYMSAYHDGALACQNAVAAAGVAFDQLVDSTEEMRVGFPVMHDLSEQVARIKQRLGVLETLWRQLKEKRVPKSNQGAA